MNGLRTQVAVVGASLGGVMAAWRAVQAGCQVCLVAEHAWLGGQMTAQAVPPDEHRLIEQGGASNSYRAFREDMRALYRTMPGFLDRATMTPGSNPGDGWVSRLCIEPVHAARWFERLLAPHVAAGRLHIQRLTRPIAAQRLGPHIQQVTVQSHDGKALTLHADVFIDATDTGELLHLAQLPYRLGKEAQAEFNEPDAPPQANRLDQQPITHVMALRRHATPGAVIEPPPRYGFWLTHHLPHHQHALFSDALPGPEPGQSAHLPFEATGDTLDWWRYRRIVSSAQWADGRADVSLINWAQNDFALQPLLDGPLPTEAVQAQARELSLCFLHWLQTQRPHWQLAPDMLGTPDGLAQQVYVRESRRIIGRSTLHQRQLMAPPAGAADAVGIGWYALDIHPTCISGHGANAAVQPFELPLGAFMPVHADNLIPACKNLSVTHLASACTRVHPVEWLAGEVAGLLAAHVQRQGWPDRPAQVAALRAALVTQGVPLSWSPQLLAQVTSVH
jgi:hypothetical protein